VAEKRSSIMGSAMITAVMLLNIDVICTGNRAYTVKTTPPDDKYANSKSFQDFINVLSQIVEKHGAEVLNEIDGVE